MALDEKDLEIARLRGQVEALKEQLANALAARGVGVTEPAVCMHFERDACNRCLRCGQVALKVPADFTTCKNPLTFMGEVWTGVTNFVPPFKVTS